MPSLLKTIRDIKRVIQRKNVKGEPTDEEVKKLSNLEEEKVKRDESARERKNAVKYHMVKFVERQKVVRKIHALDASQSDSCNLTSSRNQLLEDLAYILYFPKKMKYLSLYAKDEDDKQNNQRILKLKAIARSEAIETWGKDKHDNNQDRVSLVLNGQQSNHSDNENHYSESSKHSIDHNINESKEIPIATTSLISRKRVNEESKVLIKKTTIKELTGYDHKKAKMKNIEEPITPTLVVNEEENNDADPFFLEEEDKAVSNSSNTLNFSLGTDNRNSKTGRSSIHHSDSRNDSNWRSNNRIQPSRGSIRGNHSKTVSTSRSNNPDHKQNQRLQRWQNSSRNKSK